METNEELIKAWIGEKNQEEHYQKLMNGGFSWIACLVPGLYMAIRKMYLEVFICIFIAVAYSFIVTFMEFPEIGTNILNFIIRIIIGLSFYPLYKRHILKKIRKYQQQGLSYDEQLSIAQKDGGNKITKKTIAVIIFAIIEIIILHFAIGTGLEMWRQLEKTNYDHDIVESEDESNVWSIDGSQFSYDSSKWKTIQIDEYTALQYKDSVCYVAYIGKRDTNDEINIFDDFDDIEVRNDFETDIKETVEQGNLTFCDIEYNKINSELLEIVAYFYKDTLNGKMYMYSNNATIFSFILIYENSNYEFENEAQEILRSIMLEKENSVVESNNDIETSLTNQSNLNSTSKEVLEDLSFSLPDKYKKTEYNTEFYSLYTNEEINTDIHILINPFDNYESTEEFVKLYVYDLQSVNDFESENINGVKWIKYEIQNTISKYYYYITKYKDKYYLVEFFINDREYETDAIEHLETLKNSFELQ